jgi:hypothetical protein
MAIRGTGAEENAKAGPPDDLTAIPGITPAIAACLRQAGVTTFEQLASLEAEETVAVIGPGFEISSAVIANPEWIGEAARLSTGTRPASAALVQMRELEILPSASEGPARSLSHEQPYRVRIVVDAPEAASAAAGPLPYSITAGAKLAGHRRAVVLAALSGAGLMAPVMSFEAEGQLLPPGLYFLFVLLRFGRAAALAEAGTLHVVEAGVR